MYRLLRFRYLTLALVLFTLLLAAAVSAFVAYFGTARELKAAANRAVFNADRLVDRTSSELAKLDSLRFAPCDSMTVRELQSAVYSSLSQIREIGLIRDKRLYCTNFGATDREVPIPDRFLSIGTHIDVSPNVVVPNNTSLVVYSSRETGTAVNALFNPQVLAEFERDFEYRGYGVLSLRTQPAGAEPNATLPPINEIYSVGTISAADADGWKLSRDVRSNRSAFKAVATTSVRPLVTHGLSVFPWFLGLFGALAVIATYAVRQWLQHGNLDRLRYEAAFQRNEFAVHYQPIVSSATGQIEGLEALLRWHHPRRGLLRAAQFADLFSQDALAATVARRVIDLVEKDLPRLPSDSDVWVTINLAPTLLDDNALLTELTQRIVAIGSRRVRIEITERSPIGDYAEMLLHELRANQIRIGMDDIGTGYANLGQLQRMPFDFIKVDGILVRGITSLDGVTPVVHSLIQLARTLESDVIVEGVETEVQAKALMQAGATHLQGLYFDAARPLEELVDTIRERRVLRPLTKP